MSSSDRPLRLAVIGAGGIGGYFGGKLAAAGIDTTFIVRGPTLAALQARGLRVESIDGDFAVPSVKATDRTADVGPVDAVLLATKAWQVADAARQIRPLVGPDTVVIPLQNGIDAPRELAAVLGDRAVAGGLCAIVSYIVEPGVIRHAAGEPVIMFGEIDNRPTERLTRLCSAMRAAGLKADIPPDIQKSMWSKFVFIAPLSGIGAVTRVPTGAWRSTPETREVVERGVAEVVSVAGAVGVALDDDMVARTMARYDALAADATSSFQRDVMSGRPSELEAQIGTVVRLGSTHGVPVPVHAFLYAALLPGEIRARLEETT